MKLFPVHRQLWSSLLVLLATQSGFLSTGTQADNAHACHNEEKVPGSLDRESSLQRPYVEVSEENFLCLLYPTNTLNCSWSFPTLHKDAQLSVCISICDGEKSVNSLNHSSESRVGSSSWVLSEHEDLNVIVQFNVTLHGQWTAYNYVYDLGMIEVLSPPQNISASVKDGGLLVRWSLPRSRIVSNRVCFEYQLDMGNQENARTSLGRLFYEEQNADPSRAYRVRIRTRKRNICEEKSQWSDWSDTVSVWPAPKISMLVIISISLGVPMILLAVLLFVRYQRVSKVLFPPIPRPPKKYKSFLEKNDTFNFFHPTPSTEPEITQVEDTRPNPEKTS